jgi:hypothetical protein
MPFTFKLSKRLALMKETAPSLTAAAISACEPEDQLPSAPTTADPTTTRGSYSTPVGGVPTGSAHSCIVLGLAASTSYNGDGSPAELTVSRPLSVTLEDSK